MRIESVANQADRSGRFTVKFSDGSILRLYKQTVQDFSLYPGLELTDEEYKMLTEAAGAMSAKMRAVRIVSMSSVSKRDLQRRLVQKGEKPDQAAQAVAWMEDLSLLDDRQTAAQIVARCISKGYGISRAKQALYEKQIPKEYWDDVLSGYPDQSEAIVEFLQMRLKAGCDEKTVRKAVDALLRRGHSYQLIRKGLQEIEAYPEDPYD